MKKINLTIRKLLIKNSFYYVIAFISLLYAFICLNITRESIYKGNETSFEGVLESYTIKGNKLTFIIDGEENLRCTYYFETEEEKTDYEKNLKLGSKVTVNGTLTSPINNTIPNTFNYKEYLYYHDIFYLCSADTFSVNDENISILYKIKNFVISRIKSFNDISDYLLTFIIGDKSLLSDESMDNYRKNGVTHLFAISGMHIGLFSGCILKILKKLKFSENKRYFITITFIWFYAFLTGFSSSVLRAGLLFTLLALNKIFYTEVKGLNVLILTGSLLVFHNPFILMDIGFIYSFLTTFGLMYASISLNKHKIIGTSLVAMLFSLPVTINNFYEFNILSIMINIIFVPFVSTIVYPLCLGAFFLPFIEPLIKIILNILEWLNNFCAGFDFLHMIVPKCNLLFLIVYYGCLLILVNKKFNLCVGILVLMIIFAKLKPNFDSNYYLEFLDVGQGDSTLIRAPNKKEVVLIDTGGSLTYQTEEWKKTKKYYVSDNTITYLHSLGISEIDYLILTHGDADHLGDALNIIENIKVNNVILNRGDINYNEKQIIDSGVNVIESYDGILDLEILWTSLENDENSNSIIISLKIKDEDILLMGDATKKKELEILKNYRLKDYDIIKLGHHGSRSSSDEYFLKSINVDTAIISSGRNNKFGHPHEEVIATLEKLNIHYYNTQFLGTIQYRFSNNKIKINTFEP